MKTKSLLSKLSQIFAKSRKDLTDKKLEFVHENSRFIKDRFAELKKEMQAQLTAGEINSFNLDESKHECEFEFPEGWFSRLYQRAQGYDVFGIRALKDKVFAEHSYRQCIHLTILDGELVLSIKGLGQTTLKAGDHYKIEPGMKHSIVPNQDSFLILTARPNLK